MTLPNAAEREAPSFAMSKPPTHKEFIDSLGGPKAVSDEIKKRLRAGPTPQAVSQWLVEGRTIAWHYRPVLVLMAKDKEVPIPANFDGLGR